MDSGLTALMTPHMMSTHTRLPPARVAAGYVPEWDLHDLHSRPCPVCGEGKKEPKTVCERPDELTVKSCNSCGMTYVAQVPSDAHLDKFYQAYASYKGYASRRPKPRRRRWYECALSCSQDLYIEALERTGGLAGRTCLDFGCSTGHFLELLEYKGATATGVEIDGDARAEAQAIGLDVRTDAPADGAYDVVSALQVLEHLREPAELIAAMARLCKPDGRVIVAVPNATELSQHGSGWIGLRVDLEHLNYFNVATLTALLRNSGLWVEHVWQHRQPALRPTDLSVSGTRKSIKQLAGRALERAVRVLLPPPESFDQGTFTLSVLARKA